MCVCVYMVYIVKYLTVAKVHLLICLVRVEPFFSFRSISVHFIPGAILNSATDRALCPTNPAAIWHSAMRLYPRRRRTPTRRRQSDPDADCRSNRSHVASLGHSPWSCPWCRRPVYNGEVRERVTHTERERKRGVTQWEISGRRRFSV